MESSKKYEYHKLTKWSFKHSLNLAVQIPFRAPEILLLFILSTVFPIVRVFTLVAIPLIVMYAFCRLKWIDEPFKGEWSIAKSGVLKSLKFLTIGIGIITLLFLALVYFTAPTSEDTESIKAGFDYGNLIMAFIVPFFIFQIFLEKLVDLCEVFDRWNGLNSGHTKMKFDYPMSAYLLISIYLVCLVDLATDTFFYGPTYIIFYINSVIALSHLYTPEIPKKTVHVTANSLG